MLRSTKYKFIFVHVPKNAGSSVSEQLIPYSDYRPIKLITTPLRKLGFPVNIGAEPLSAHSTASEIRDLFGHSYSNYFSFGFSRNPYDRIYSLYSYVRYSKVRNPEGFKIKTCTGINDYIKNFLGIKHSPKTQFDFFYDQDRHRIVSFVGSVESMDESVSYISDKLNLPFKLKHLNKSLKSPRNDPLTSESIIKINNYFKDDFDAFNYERL